MFYIGEQYRGDDLAKIANEHRAICIKLLKSTLIGQIFFPLLVVTAFWHFLDQRFLTIWFGFYVVATLCMSTLLYHWYPNSKKPNKHRIIDRIILTWASIVSIVLIIPMFLFSPTEHPEQAIFFYIITFGHLASALGLGGYWPSFYLSYSGISLAAFLLHALISYHEPNYFLVIGVLAFSPFLIHISLTFNRQSAENVVLKRRYSELAKENESQRKEAENMAEARKRLLASTGHDLRQPLQAMNFFLASIHEAKAIEDDTLLNRLQLSIDGMNDILEHMLDLSKIESETLKPHIEPVYIRTMFDMLEQNFSGEAYKKSLQFKVVKVDAQLKTDQVLLARILSNLISNAIKYTDAGSVTLTAKAVDQDHVSITITDTGIGIDTEDQERIFDEFVQLHNPERDRKKGLGLGLSIVKRLCSLLDIPLTVTSDKENGSDFKLVVPIHIHADVTTKKSNVRPENTPTIPACYNKQKTNIDIALIIDDEQEIRESLSHLLAQWGIDVLSAESAAQATELVSNISKAPSLIISDYRLRDNQTGVDAINNVKALFPNEDIPAFLLSGDTQAQQLNDIQKSGYQLLHKPIKATQLRSLIQRVLA